MKYLVFLMEQIIYRLTSIEFSGSSTAWDGPMLLEILRECMLYVHQRFGSVIVVKGYEKSALPFWTGTIH